MILKKHSGIKQRSTACVLADIAHELSSISEWQSRLQDVLAMLGDFIPVDTAALGIQMRDWVVFYCPDPEDPERFSCTLLEHHALLSDASPGDILGAEDWRESEGITSDGGSCRSFLSLPVLGAGQLMGVLHVSVDQDDAYSPDDVSILSIVSLQIGSYIKGILEGEQAEVKAQEMETLRDEAERRRAELESFISSTADGVVLFDSERRVLLANEMIRHLINPPADAPMEEWIRNYELRTLDGCSLPRHLYPSTLALQGQTTIDKRLKLITPWRESAVSISASPVKDPSGRLLGGVLSFHDISSLIEFEREKEELFEREHHIAQMLQQALVPPQREYDIEGARIAVRYQPALKEAEIGGDFYDVFRLADGRIGILIGDVAGKGLNAAIRVAAVRYAVRSYAYVDSSPGVVLTLVNELLCRDDPTGDALMTAVYAVIDTVAGTLTYASGGHEPPLMRKADGHIEELTNAGRALGVYGGCTYTEASRSIVGGETLVIVTDGIVEARSSEGLFGPERVQEFIASHPGLSPSEIASGLLDAATQYAGGSLQDDAAIVVVEVVKPS